MRAIGKLRRGEPLLFLLAVLVAWVAVRTIQLSAGAAAGFPDLTLSEIVESRQAMPVPLKIDAAPPATRTAGGDGTGLAVVGTTRRRNAGFGRKQAPAAEWPPLAASDEAAAGPFVALPLLAFGAAAAPGLPLEAAPQVPLMPRAPDEQAGSRWSGDAWLLARADSDGPLATGEPSYGRSQVGGVVRYALAPGSDLRPGAHLRVSAALSGARDREAAVGLSGRPLPLPVRVVAEARLSETDGGTHMRPALYAVTELPPLTLPSKVQGEAYLQGGYVGGEFATGFIDGQARIERELVSAGKIAVTAGAGVWGGVQEGASRIDIGPSAAASFRVGAMRGRVAADYRFRIAGTAEPASGPALTVSAGF